MPKIKWDQTGERLYETGVSKGVLYPYANNAYAKGVAWNGLINVSESPEGAEATPLYADNIKYLNLMSAEEFKATIEAYTYPDEFAACNGEASLEEGVSIGQQKRSQFGLSYQTKIGNDVDSELGYKIHLVYGALASPSSKSHSTINNDPEAAEMSWDITTTPVEVTGHRPTSVVEIDSTKVKPEELANLEKALYGDADTEPKLPSPTEVAAMFTDSLGA